MPQSGAQNITYLRLITAPPWEAAMQIWHAGLLQIKLISVSFREQKVPVGGSRVFQYLLEALVSPLIRF
jgi:hypothetical protein